MTPKGHRVIRGCPDLLHNPKVKDFFRLFDLVYDLKGHGFIRGRRDILYDPESHGDLCGSLDLVYDTKRSWD